MIHLQHLYKGAAVFFLLFAIFNVLQPQSATAYFQGYYQGYYQSYYQPYYQGYYQPSYASGATWVLGANYVSSYSEYFSGNIDDVRVYNRALSAGEVTNIYNSSPSSSGLVGWWPIQGLLESVAEGFWGWTQFAGSITPPCADSAQSMCFDPDTVETLDPWCQPVQTFCTFGCVDEEGICRQPEGCLSTSASTCQSTGLARTNTPATLYWDVEYATVCTVTGTNGDSWSSLEELAGVQTSPITQRTVFTLDCENGALVDQVTINLIPTYQEI
jgi:hypothetical protein